MTEADWGGGGGGDKLRPSLLLPVKPSDRPHREARSRRKRHNQEQGDSEGVGSTCVSSQGAVAQISWALEQTKRGAKGTKKKQQQPVFLCVA